MINMVIVGCLVIFAIYFQYNCIKCARTMYDQLMETFRGHREERKVKGIATFVGVVFNVIVFLCLSIPIALFFI